MPTWVRVGAGAIWLGCASGCRCRPRQQLDRVVGGGGVAVHLGGGVHGQAELGHAGADLGLEGLPGPRPGHRLDDLAICAWN